MKYFIIYAHPEPRSLSGYLKGAAVAALEAAGHEVEVSDLYAMRFKAVADTDDFSVPAGEAPLDFARATRSAYAAGHLTPDVLEEQRKLLWADAVILQFPIWWYGMPAILKGWIDRVYAYGFAYGRGPHTGEHWGDRFGDGLLKSKRAMVSMTVGGRMAHYGPRGVNGAIDDLLWPIHHGVLFYPGMDVVPPVVFYEVGRAQADSVQAMKTCYIERLLGIDSVEPIPLRPQNYGDYNDVQVLKADKAADVLGHSLHQRSPAFVSNTWLGVSGDYTPKHIAPNSRDNGDPVW